MRTITKITSVGKKKVFDISVVDAEHYVLENGVVTHNTGIYYSADTIATITRAQEKSGGALSGYRFTLSAAKSRSIKEGSKLPIVVTFDGGINKYSGLLELAEAAGVIKKLSGAPSFGRDIIDPATGEVTIDNKKFYDKMLQSDEFWGPILVNPLFHEKLRERFILGENVDLIQQEDSNFLAKISATTKQIVDVRHANSLKPKTEVTLEPMTEETPIKEQLLSDEDADGTE